jgi:hypothetical protein
MNRRPAREGCHGRLRLSIGSIFSNALSRVAGDYQPALVEFDLQKLPERVQAAETAIFKRLQAISQNIDNQAERQAIEDALASLRLLKREMGFPDWEQK